VYKEMWFIINIVMIIILCFTRLFCIITTFNAIKYDEYFYEGNPIARKLLNTRCGKALAVIIGYLGLSGLLIGNFMIQIVIPNYLWIHTIMIFIVFIVYGYDFILNMYMFLKYDKIK